MTSHREGGATSHPDTRPVIRFKIERDREGWLGAAYEERAGIPRYAAWNHYPDPMRAAAFAVWHFAKALRVVRRSIREGA